MNLWLVLRPPQLFRWRKLGSEATVHEWEGLGVFDQLSQSKRCNIVRRRLHTAKMSDQKEMKEVLIPYHQVAFKQSSTKRWLIVALVVLGVVAAVVISALVVALGVVAASKDEGEDVCLTDSCVELASNVRSGLDSSVDPCEDFYNFTCGNWVENNVIPQGKLSSCEL